MSIRSHTDQVNQQKLSQRTISLLSRGLFCALEQVVRHGFAGQRKLLSYSRVKARPRPLELAEIAISLCIHADREIRLPSSAATEAAGFERNTDPFYR